MRGRWSPMACAIILFASPAMAADPMIGTWYGEGEPGDAGEVWLAHVLPDGTFKVTFRMCRPESRLLIDEGTWKVTGQQMIIAYDHGDGQPIHGRDVYQILSSDGHRMQYKLTQSDSAPAASIGFVFNSTKVPDDFKIPGCDFIS